MPPRLVARARAKNDWHPGADDEDDKIYEPGYGPTNQPNSARFRRHGDPDLAVSKVGATIGEVD